MEKELFNDLIASCKEAAEFRKGNISLKTTVFEISPENWGCIEETDPLDDEAEVFGGVS
jgi:hypothetical protein